MHVSSITNTRRVEGEAAEMFFPKLGVELGRVASVFFFDVTVSCIVTNVHSSINPSLSFPPSSPVSLLPRLPPESPAASEAEDLPSSIPPLALAADKRLRGLNSKAFRSRIGDFYHLQREREE